MGTYASATEAAALTLLATVQGSRAEASITTLQQGVAQRARAPLGEYTFFRFDVATVDTLVQVTPPRTRPLILHASPYPLPYPSSLTVHPSPLTPTPNPNPNPCPQP